MAVRPEYTTRFVEDATTIRQRLVDNIPDAWRKETGDFMVDAVTPDIAEVLQLQLNQDRILQNAFPQFCEDDMIDYHMQLRGIPRQEATKSRRKLIVTASAGVRIPRGYTLTSVVLDGDGNPIEFTADAQTIFSQGNLTQTITVTCNIEGTVGNLPNGTEFVLQPPIPGIENITDGGVELPAADKENPDSAWTRLLFKATNPDTGGNRNDYKRWITDDFPTDMGAAVGKCAVISCGKGNGTVQIVVIGTDYLPATPTLVSMLKEYLDPAEYEGDGYGKAPGGAVVHVEAAEPVYLDIAATIVLGPTAVASEVKSQFMQQVTEYLQSITFEEIPNSQAHDLYPVAYNRIGALLIGTPGVENYSDLTINGATDDIPLQGYLVPVLRTVTLE